MQPMDFRSRWVLVTGASSGLGWHMASQLAREHGANLVLVARRKERLEELKREIEAAAGTEVHAIAADLSNVSEIDRVFEEATKDRSLYGAVLNAGVTHFGPHHELSWHGFEQMLNTNVTGVVRMTSHVVPHLERRNEGGGLMLIASMAGLTPVPYQSAYSGTKAFLVHFACGLHHELEGKEVSVTTFAPGGIRTEMTAGERFGPLNSWLMPVEACAREGIEAFRKRRYVHTPGITNRLGSIATRLLPQRIITGRVAATYRNALKSAGALAAERARGAR